MLRCGLYSCKDNANRMQSKVYFSYAEVQIIFYKDNYFWLWLPLCQIFYDFTINDGVWCINVKRTIIKRPVR